MWLLLRTCCMSKCCFSFNLKTMIISLKTYCKRECYCLMHILSQLLWLHLKPDGIRRGAHGRMYTVYVCMSCPTTAHTALIKRLECTFDFTGVLTYKTKNPNKVTLKQLPVSTQLLATEQRWRSLGRSMTT